MFAKNNNNDRFPSPFREITIANIVEKKKGRRRRKMKSRRGEKKNIRGNFSLTNSMIHALARARNIKKHFEETKAQRGERRGEGMDGKIETIADSWIRGTIRYPRVIPREKSVTRYGWIAPPLAFAGGATPLNSLYFLSKQTVKTADHHHLGEAERDERRRIGLLSRTMKIRMKIHRSIGRKRLLDFSRASRLLFFFSLLLLFFFFFLLSVRS